MISIIGNLISPISTCVRAKKARMAFKKFHTVRGKNFGDYVSVNIAVFIDCPSREGYRYVVQFLDYATKHSWVYSMTDCDEFIKKVRNFVDIKLRRYDAKIRHYHIHESDCYTEAQSFEIHLESG